MTNETKPMRIRVFFDDGECRERMLTPHVAWTPEDIGLFLMPAYLDQAADWLRDNPGECSEGTSPEDVVLEVTEMLDDCEQLSCDWVDEGPGNVAASIRHIPHVADVTIG